MTTPKREPGAKTGAESVEVRKVSNGAGSGAEGKYGKGAEEVRIPCVSSIPAVPAAPECPPMPPAADPVLPRVLTVGQKARESIPADAPPPHGADRAGAAPGPAVAPKPALRRLADNVVCMFAEDRPAMPDQRWCGRYPKGVSGFNGARRCAISARAEAQRVLWRAGMEQRRAAAELHANLLVRVRTLDKAVSDYRERLVIPARS